MTTNEKPEGAAQPDVVGDIAQSVRDRLEELQPYLDEAAKLEAILAVTDEQARPRTRTSNRSRGSSDGRRRQGDNKRAILAMIGDQPGITAAEIARVSGMKRTVVASTVSRLKRMGELRAEGRGVRLPTEAEAKRPKK